MRITEERTREGKMKLSAPRRSRKMRDETKPVIAGSLYVFDLHCSTKRTTKSAVIEKSTPVKSKGIEPIRFPMIEPIIQ